MPNFFYFACGDVFRNLRLENPLGKKFIEYSSKGKLVPDELTVELWRKHVESSTSKGEFHPEHDMLILDGIPRNTHQVKMMSEAIDVRAVLHLACSDMSKMEERIQRRALKENRMDDGNIEVIRQRFETYKKESQPVLDCYPVEIVHDVDSTNLPATVLRDILSVIVKLELTA